MDKGRKKELMDRIDVAEVLQGKGKGTPDKAYVVPARVAKNIKKEVFDWLGINADETDMEWIFLADPKTGEHIAVLVKK